MEGIFCGNMNRNWVHFVDIDGDGVREIVALPKSGGDYYHAYARVNGTWTDRALKLQVQHSGRRVHFLDTNGDGLPEAIYTGLGQATDNVLHEDGTLPSDHSVIQRYSWAPPTGLSIQWLLADLATESDLPMRADNVGGDFVDLDPWYPNSNTFPSRPIGGIEWVDEFGDQASVLDFDGDGLQDLMVPMRNGDPADPSSPVPCQVIWRSNGHGGFELIRLNSCLQYLSSSGGALQPVLQSLVADLNGDGRDDILAPLKGNGETFAFSPLLSAGPHDQLVGVIDGTNPLSADDPAVVPTVAITYDALIDRSYPSTGTQSEADDVTYLPRFQDGNDCGYPRTCLLGSQQVVKRYALNNGKNGVRTFGVQYRDGRVDVRGKRGLGFSSRVVRDLDTGTGAAQFYDNITYDGPHQAYPYAGVVKATWSWVPAKHAPWSYRADYVQTLLSTISTTDGQTYFVDPTVQHTFGKTYTAAPAGHFYATAAYLFDSASDSVDERWSIRGVDEYGNVLEQSTNVPMAGVKDHTVRTVDLDLAAWLIARVDRETVCSTSANLTQCRSTSTTFDTFGDPETVTRDDGGDPTAGLMVTYQHDDFGHVVYTTSKGAGAVVRTACTSYDATRTFPFASGNSLGHVVFARYDGGLGVMRAAVDANGLASQFGYDGFGNVTRTIDTAGVATVLTRSRVKDGGPQGAWWRNHTTSVTEHGAESETIADAGGRTVRTRRRGPAISTCFLGACTTSPWFAQDTSYDALGNVDSVSTSYLETIAPAFRHYTTYVRDHAGRVFQETAPNGHVTETVYTVGTAYQATAIQTSDSMGQTIAYHDAAGRTVQVYDTLGHGTTYAYGPFATLIGVTLPDSTSSSTTFDAWGRPTERTGADRGTTTATYDGFDEVRTEVDAAKRASTYFYDQLGRMVSKLQDDAGVSTWASWTYDTAKFGLGRLAATAASSGVTTALTYDWAGRPESSTMTIAGATFIGGNKYDVYGHVTEVAYPSALGLGLRLGYDRDVRGNVLAVRDLASDHVLWTAVELDRRGALAHGVFDNNVQTWRVRDDASGGITHLWATLGAEPIQDLWLTYDDRLRTITRAKLIMGVSKAEGFRYDALDRLQCAFFAPGTIVNGVAVCDQQIDYDDVGNITAKSDLGAYGYAAQHPHAVEKVGGLGFTYDDVGNQLTRAGATKTSITYTPFDLPLTYSIDDQLVATMTYGADQQRARKLTATTDTRYVGGLTQQVTDLVAKATREEFYVPVAGATIIVTRRLAQAESRSYALLDQLGSTDVVVGPNGVERRSYDVWGHRRSPSWDGNNAGPFTSHPTIGFTGQEAEDEVGLVNMKGRIYDPMTARFLSTDPHVAAPTSAQSWNPYSYVLNNPLAFTDPSGFDPIHAGGGSITPMSSAADRVQVNNRTEKQHWVAAGGVHRVSSSASSHYDNAGNSVDNPSSAPSGQHAFSPKDAVVGVGDQLWNQPGDNAEALSGALARLTGSETMKGVAATLKDWNALGKAIRDSDRTEEELSASTAMAPWVQAAQAAMLAKGGVDLLRGGTIVVSRTSEPEYITPSVDLEATNPGASGVADSTTRLGTTATVNANYLDSKSLVNLVPGSPRGVNARIEFGTPPGDGSPGTARVVYSDGVVKDVTWDYGVHDWVDHL